MNQTKPRTKRREYPSAQLSGSYYDSSNAQPVPNPNVSNSQEPQYETNTEGNMLQPAMVSLMRPDVNSLHSSISQIKQPAYVHTLVPSTDDKIGEADYMFSSMTVIPRLRSTFEKLHAPLSITLRPFNPMHEETVHHIHGAELFRCRWCGAFITSFVEFNADRTTFLCSACALENKIPNAANLSGISCVQPNPNLQYTLAEYTGIRNGRALYSRAMRPPTFVFIIDVTLQATQVSVLHVLKDAISSSINDLKESFRLVSVAFILVADNVSLLVPTTKDTLEQIVLPDLDDFFLPYPVEHFLLDLNTQSKAIASFLNNLPSFGTTSSSLCLGNALEACKELLSNGGGKTLCFLSSLPNLGSSALAVRDSVATLNSVEESNILLPKTDYYKNIALDFADQYISSDLFVFGASYHDVKTLEALPQLTGGKLHCYFDWNAATDNCTDALHKDLRFSLTSLNALGCLITVTPPKNIKLHCVHGNVYRRAINKCSIPYVSCDQTVVFEFEFEGSLNPKQFATFQIQLLYTSPYTGQKTLRLFTYAAAINEDMLSLYSGMDSFPLFHNYLETSFAETQSKALTDIRTMLSHRLCDFFNAYKKNTQLRHPFSSIVVPNAIQRFPLLIHALLRNTALRYATNIPSDFRSCLWFHLSTATLKRLRFLIYPLCVSLIEFSKNDFTTPHPVPLLFECMRSDNAYLLFDGISLYLIVRKDVTPDVLVSVLQKDVIPEVFGGKVNFSLKSIKFVQQIDDFVHKVIDEAMCTSLPNVIVVRESNTSSLWNWIRQSLLESSFKLFPGYSNFLQLLDTQKVNFRNSHSS
ncbi:hypothetical protein SJAG_05345 [Schizosaccharomyces japonicus yFS275]|uniref:Uncharacterized protein n=1 Tax=Schizosaccharomyces japonicus (strain yFS275 / FY16936) TaxID=402676 RepID=B6K7Y1_SCHJY|nr:hypothetical protein SJAG_05345 [Schizosaccharomyces japonicus yFS275]EEB09635.1 hypothetical protein SJAG_05345 [Schizosaccharomyces japonicus yFS275]